MSWPLTSGTATCCDCVVVVVVWVDVVVVVVTVIGRPLETCSVTF